MKSVTKRNAHPCSAQVVILLLFSISLFWCTLIGVEQEQEVSVGSISEDEYDDEISQDLNLKKSHADLIVAGEDGGDLDELEDVYEDDANYFESEETAAIEATDFSYDQEDKDFHYHHYAKNGTKVVIALVSCQIGTRANYLDRTALLIKSILISAELYNVTRVEFHMFLKDTADERYFLERLEEMGYPSGYEQVDMDLIVHSAVEIIPVRYRRQMVFQKRFRCGYTKFFFPTALPKVEAIIHLDVSMLVTGSILKLWELFSEMKEDHQVIGVPKNMVQDEYRNYLELDRSVSGDTPHPSPKGVNSGLLLMNLTRMRAFNWEEKFIRAYTDYSKIARLNPQKVLNILLFYNPALFFPIPCSFNFLSNNCNAGYSCKSAQEDGQGIHVIQSNNNFDDHKAPFHPLLRYYHMYNMTKKGRDPVKDLMIPIRTAFDRKSKISKCYGKLNNLLFKSFF